MCVGGGVTAGNASHNASNARGVTAGKVERNSSMGNPNSRSNRLLVRLAEQFQFIF